MIHDSARAERNASAIHRSGYSALICALPSNVLLLSGGYWPIVGSSLAIAGADGHVALVVPEDEKALAEQVNADAICTFQPASLDDLRVEEDVVWNAVAEAASAIGISGGTIGCEMGAAFEPASYISMHRFRMSLHEGVKRALPAKCIADASKMLARLRSIYTPVELDCLRRSCRASQDAFANVREQLHAGFCETAVATRARSALYESALGRDAQHFAVVSGPRSAAAFGAYAISSERILVEGDLVLVHCNSNIGGYWTDVTRTFCLGDPTVEQRRMYDAVAAAREEALDAISPGVAAADVDKAARTALGKRGFEMEFKHPAGHGVGFSAIDHNALPRLHPKSPDLLEVGMVFNLEPAIYVEGRYGMRHCDMVAVTASGAEVLTPFCSTQQDWIVGT